MRIEEMVRTLKKAQKLFRNEAKHYKSRIPVQKAHEVLNSIREKTGLNYIFLFSLGWKLNLLPPADEFSKFWNSNGHRMKLKKIRKWTEEEIDFLKRQVKSRRKKIEIPGRTHKAIITKIRKLHLYLVWWTSEEIESLKSQVESASSWSEINLPGRTQNAIKDKLYELSFYFPRKKRILEKPLSHNKRNFPDWTYDEKISLLNQVFNGVVIEEIKINNRVLGGIKSKLHRLKLLPWAWTISEDNLLKRQIKSGVPLEEIYVCGKSAQVISWRIKKLGLQENPKIKKGIPDGLVRSNIPKWTAEEVDSLKFQFFQGRSFKEIKIPGRSIDGIRRKLKDLGLLITKPWKTTKWTIKEIRRLEYFAKYRGMSAGKIFRARIFEDRSLGSIAQQIRRKKFARNRLIKRPQI